MTEKTREEIWEEIMEFNPKLFELFLFVRDNDEDIFFRKKAWQEIIKKDSVPTSYLAIVVAYDPFFRDQAWKEILRRGPKDDDLDIIFERVPSLRREIKDKFKVTGRQALFTQRINS